ncbi:uncharacterized protein B0I36DRAFT_109525 [Microdochium trichocladiopsis]|uniref:Secreted protein n=1 Tax=Microdochium trichocladiopsis TaxID=1682393 RepID=A0A9P8Y961_9PEZI|nr:uncharacterized protein B0I36DRAFT_109525 [Microdochium trichocladiopsis]KAH7033469.1 hypothetical protein B0I36DRAFT_109525 [Microdochium trichocladiopsis]
MAWGFSQLVWCFAVAHTQEAGRTVYSFSWLRLRPRIVVLLRSLSLPLSFHSSQPHSRTAPFLSRCSDQFLILPYQSDTALHCHLRQLPRPANTLMQTMQYMTIVFLCVLPLSQACLMPPRTRAPKVSLEIKKVVPQEPKYKAEKTSL